MDPDMDMSRLPLRGDHPNQPVSNKEIDEWLSRIDDVGGAIQDFLQSDPDELERRRIARRAEIASIDAARKRQKTTERYDTRFYRKYEDDEFIDKLLMEADKTDKEKEQAAAASERKKRELAQASSKNALTDFERLALEEAHKLRGKANALVGQGKYAEAHELYSHVVGMDPDDDALLLAVRNNRALTSLRLDPPNFQQAIEDATFVIKHEARNVKARMRRAAGLSGLHRHKEALADLKVVLRCDSTIAEAKTMMLAAQLQVEETQAADAVGADDAKGAEDFVKSIDALAAATEKLQKLLLVPPIVVDCSYENKEKETEKNNAASAEAKNTSDAQKLAAAARESLERIVELSRCVGLDDGFASLFRLRGGFKVLLDLTSLLQNSGILLAESGNNNKSAPAELFLALAASIRVLCTVLTAERTAATFGATEPETVKMQFCVLLGIVLAICGGAQQQPQPTTRVLAVAGAAMSALASMLSNSATNAAPLVSWWNAAVLPEKQREELLSATSRCFIANHPLLPDALQLGAAIFAVPDATSSSSASASQQLLSRARNIVKVLFSVLETCRSQRDFSSPRSRAVATMLLRVSAKPELASDVGTHAVELVDTMITLVSVASAASCVALLCGMMAEAALSALHNAIVLGAIDRTKLPDLFFAKDATENNSPPAWIASFIKATIASTNNLQQQQQQQQQQLVLPLVVTNCSSVVSKFLAVVSKSISPPASAISEDPAVQKQLKRQRRIAGAISANMEALCALCRACTAHLEQQRDAKAVKLADADQTSVDIVSKAAAQWASALPQANLLENATLSIAALIMMPSSVSGKEHTPASPMSESAASLLAPLSVDLIRQGTNLLVPRVVGNAALWISQKLAASPSAMAALKKKDDVVRVLFTAIKELSSQLYDVERAAVSVESKTQQTMLTSARKNVAVCVAKLCAVSPEALEAFREQDGAKLFSSLQLS